MHCPPQLRNLDAGGHRKVLIIVLFLLFGSEKSLGWTMQGIARFPLRSSLFMAIGQNGRLGARTKSPRVHEIAHRNSRLFGSKRGVPGNPLGTISIYNDQNALIGINEEALRQTILKISKLIGYETYDVTLLLVEDEEMQETNLESRGVDAPTDILSFPFHFHKKPGLLVEPEFDIPDYYTLGDMMVDVPYVIRRCREDTVDRGNSSDDDDDDDDEDRGVSGAMANVPDPEKRIHMLLVHGMLHLVGYDHEVDDEYEAMVLREEEILKELGYDIMTKSS